MKDLRIFVKDISELKEFRKFDDLFKLVKDYGNNVYLYERTCGYELIKAPAHKNPDGNIVHRYPGNEEWGKYGFTFMSTECRAFKKRLEELLGREE